MNTLTYLKNTTSSNILLCGKTFEPNIPLMRIKNRPLLTHTDLGLIFEAITKGELIGLDLNGVVLSTADTLNNLLFCQQHLLQNIGTNDTAWRLACGNYLRERIAYHINLHTFASTEEKESTIYSLLKSYLYTGLGYLEGLKAELQNMPENTFFTATRLSVFIQAIDVMLE